MNGTNGKQYYTIGFRIYTKKRGMQRIDYVSRIELDSKPLVDEIYEDIYLMFGSKIFNKIDRVFTLTYEDADIGVDQVLWFSDLKWREANELA